MLLMLDLFSTLCFACVGASIALRLRMNFIAIGLSAMLPAMGGGTVREIILGSDTLFWITTPSYLLAVLVAIFIAVLLAQIKTLPQSVCRLMDSLGTCVFIMVGVLAAVEAGCNPIVVVLLGMLTGIGGGIIRQLLFDRHAVLENPIKIVLSMTMAFLSSAPVFYEWQIVGTILVLTLLHYGLSEIHYKNSQKILEENLSTKLIRVNRLRGVS